MLCEDFGQEGKECILVRGSLPLIVHRAVHIRTGWNTKISARETNYGTRIDYVLITPGLLPWVKDGNIQPSIKGSDHCPVYIDLHDEITLETGDRITLQDVMKLSESRQPPTIAAKFWDEFQGKQTLLSSFFGKRSNINTPPELSAAALSSESDSVSLGQSLLTNALEALGSQQVAPATDVKPAISEADSSVDKADIPADPAGEAVTSPSFVKQPALARTDISSNISPAPQAAPLPRNRSDEQRKRQRTEGPVPGPSKTKKLKPGQAKLSSFFVKPPVASTQHTLPEVVEVLDSDGVEEHTPSASSAINPGSISSEDLQNQMEADYRFACELSSSQGPSSSQNTDSSQSKEAWSTLFAPMPVPKCFVHGEPAKEFRVNKPGPNKGKTFFLCSR